MDYVRGELLRQKRALEALLGGGAEEEHEEQKEAQAEPLPESRETAVGRLRSASAGETADRVPPVWRDAVRSARSVRTGSVRPAEESVWGSTGSGAFAGGVEERVRTDARLLSRTIQRDARRYDGGFTGY